MIIKTLLLFHFVFSYCMSYCQSHNFSLVGRISGLDSGKVQISNRDSELILDNKIVPIKKGVFKFSGLISHPALIAIIILDPIKLSGKTPSFFIDSGLQYFSTNIDSFYSRGPTITGSKTNMEYITAYKTKFESSDIKLDNWRTSHQKTNDEYKDHIPVILEDSFRNALNNIRDINDNLLLDYIKRHPGSYVGLGNLFEAASRGYRSIYESSFELLNFQLKNTYIGKLIEKTSKSSRSTAVNAIFPSIELIDINNTPVKLMVTTNKFTLIDFWFSHCGSCISQFGKLRNLYKIFNRKGFQIIGISNDPESEVNKLKKVISQYKLPWLQWRDKNSLLCAQLAIRSFPTNFLLDSSGRIIAKNIEPSQLKSFLEKNLAKMAPTKRDKKQYQ